MRYQILTKLMTIVILASLLPVQLACQSEREDKVSRMKELVRGLNVRIDFYGKVADQQGQPIEGADVLLQLSKYSPTNFIRPTDIHAKTDKLGNFSIHGETGSEISVESIHKDGYEFTRTSDIARDYVYSHPHGYLEPLFVPDPKHPIAFPMRKKGEEVFIVHGEGGFTFDAKDSGSEQAFDAIGDIVLKGQDLKTLRFNGDPVSPDLKAKATWESKTSTWTVVLSAGTPGGGLLVLDRKLYEAPKEGYRDNFTFKIQVPKNSGQSPLVIIPGSPVRTIRLTAESPTPPQQILAIYLRSRQPTASW